MLGKQEYGRRANPAVTKQIEAHRTQLEACEGYCRELGHAPADVAIVLLLANLAVTAPIVGPRELAQL